MTNYGNPRCRFCEGRGIMAGPNGRQVCVCRKGKPNERILRELAAFKLPDFIKWCDEDRR